MNSDVISNVCMNKLEVNPNIFNPNINSIGIFVVLIPISFNALIMLFLILSYLGQSNNTWSLDSITFVHVGH
jgi:hypothetical protein